MYSLCARPREEPVGGSVEAPFIVRHGDWWWCCRGANSTYNVVVGRASRVTGPYSDRAGKPMMEGGGTSVIKSHDSELARPRP
jgi:arabinan endo-1,5-alpha-L-arabinosidase